LPKPAGFAAEKPHLFVAGASRRNTFRWRRLVNPPTFAPCSQSPLLPDRRVTQDRARPTLAKAATRQVATTPGYAKERRGYKFRYFLRNPQSGLSQYMRERPESLLKQEVDRPNNKGNCLMKNRNIHCKRTMPALLMALALCCSPSLSPQATGNGGGEKEKHGPTIVGLWHVQYSGNLVFESFDQWHSDGLEFEVANGFGLSCQGTWKQKGAVVQLFHTGWNYDANGQLAGYFNEAQTLRVSADRQSYDGTWVLKDYDTNGNQLDQLTGTLHATRLSLNTPL
jgi:hypothetical protein